MKTRPADFRSYLSLAVRRLALAGALAAASLTGAFADHGMMKPEMPMEHDSPMGEKDQGQMGQMEPKDEKGMSGASAKSGAPPALPGFSGTPRVYHMGATGLFLDHPEHVTLTAKQRSALEAIKAKAAKNQATYRGQIEKAEGEVWALTGAERPDAAALDMKIREIEAMRRDQRMAYIQAVGAAAEVLTNDQRKQLAGLENPKPSSPPPAAASDPSAHKPEPKGK